jgi:shikimate kinase
MGAGKTSIGRRLAARLELPFTDADQEIETSAGLTIREIFELHGEPAFRRIERRVVAELLGSPPRVLASGGGAFIDPETRAHIRARGVSVWLKADLDVLLARVERRRGVRPLLAGGDPRATLARLMEERYPIYAEADVTVDSGAEPHDRVVQRVVEALRVAPAIRGTATADGDGAAAP